MFKKFFIVSTALFILLSGFGRKNGPEKIKALYRARQKHWVDSVCNQLSGDERIGQLFMVAAWSDAKRSGNRKWRNSSPVTTSAG